MLSPVLAYVLVGLAALLFFIEAGKTRSFAFAAVGCLVLALFFGYR